MAYQVIKNNKTYVRYEENEEEKVINKDVIAIFMRGSEDIYGATFYITENLELYTLDEDKNEIKLYDNIVYVSSYSNIFACIDIQGIIYSNIEYFQESPNGIVFTKVAISEYHLVALDNQGNLWSCGQNRYGECGIDPSFGTIDNLKQITQDIIFVDVQCNSLATLALDIDGNIYGCGKVLRILDDGLGLVIKLTKFNLGINIVTILMGETSFFSIDENGNVYGFGEKNSLGLSLFIDEEGYTEYTDKFVELNLNFVPVAIANIFDTYQATNTILKDKDGRLYINLAEKIGFANFDTPVDLLVNENPLIKPSKKTKSAKINI